MSGSTKTIYLVDDDPDFLDFARRVLARAGHAVECFSDPQEALRRMDEARPDLVVSDLMMSSLDAGFSLARTVKESEALRGVPVVIVTAISTQLGIDFSPKGEADLAAMHADALLEKPVAPQALAQVVERLLGRGRGGGAG